jgi:hypothetical protein
MVAMEEQAVDKMLAEELLVGQLERQQLRVRVHQVLPVRMALGMV